jgi:hypothetical protein
MQCTQDSIGAVGARLGRGRIFALICMASTLYAGTDAFAAHPLVTDDTTVQGLGGRQLEVNVDRSVSHGTNFSDLAANATLTLGWSDNLDVAYNGLWLRHQVAESPVSYNRGLGDASVFMKWRTYSEDRVSAALKPVIYFPVGDHDKGLGSDRVRLGLTGIGAWNDEGWSLLGNFGYFDNANKDSKRTSIWSGSSAFVLGLTDKLRGATELGGASNSDPTAKKYPLFANFGLIYSATEKFDLDVGYKKGLNDAEVKFSFGAGATLRW